MFASSKFRENEIHVRELAASSATAFESRLRVISHVSVVGPVRYGEQGREDTRRTTSSVNVIRAELSSPGVFSERVVIEHV